MKEISKKNSNNLFSFYEDLIFPKIKNKDIVNKLTPNLDCSDKYSFSKQKKFNSIISSSKKFGEPYKKLESYLKYDFEKDTIYLSSSDKKTTGSSTLLSITPGLYFNESGQFFNKEKEEQFFKVIEKRVSERFLNKSIVLSNNKIIEYLHSTSLKELIYSLAESDKYFGFSTIQVEDYFGKYQARVNIFNKGSGYLYQSIKSFGIDLKKDPEERLDDFISKLPLKIRDKTKLIIERELNFINQLDSKDRDNIVISSLITNKGMVQRFDNHSKSKDIYNFSLNIGYFALTVEEVEVLRKELNPEFIKNITNGSLNKDNLFTRKNERFYRYLSKHSRYLEYISRNELYIKSDTLLQLLKILTIFDKSSKYTKIEDNGDISTLCLKEYRSMLSPSALSLTQTKKKLKEVEYKLQKQKDIFNKIKENIDH